MKKSNRKYIKTIEILESIKKYIENKYNIINCNFYKDTEEFVYSRLNFQLETPYYNVPVEIRRDYNYKPTILLSVKFKNPRKQRRGITTGYCFSVYYSSDDNYCDYLSLINFHNIDTELNKILNNIKSDGTWCDEREYDD